jgi:DNA-binding MarR family transcriptional regulator
VYQNGYLKSWARPRADDLIAAIGITAAVNHRHLKSLLADGLIEKSYSDPSGHFRSGTNGLLAWRHADLA